MVNEFARILEIRGFTSAEARDAAEIFAQNSLAGVPGHGLNRFPRVVDYLDRGQIDPNARGTCVARRCSASERIWSLVFLQSKRSGNLC